jgi:hypothetical protein
LAGVDVTCPFHTVTPVFFVATMHAVTADEAVKSCPNRFCGGNGFNEYPNLDHVARLPVVGTGFEARCDDDTVLVLVKEKTVAHRLPPIDSMRATRVMMSAKPIMARGPWYLLGIFMM